MVSIFRLLGRRYGKYQGLSSFLVGKGFSRSGRGGQGGERKWWQGKFVGAEVRGVYIKGLFASKSVSSYFTDYTWAMSVYSQWPESFSGVGDHPISPPLTMLHHGCPRAMLDFLLAQGGLLFTSHWNTSYWSPSRKALLCLDTALPLANLSYVNNLSPSPTLWDSKTFGSQRESRGGVSEEKSGTLVPVMTVVVGKGMFLHLYLYSGNS